MIGTHRKDGTWQETVVHHPVGVGDAQNRDNQFLIYMRVHVILAIGMCRWVTVGSMCIMDPTDYV